ncbi:hypothetical protein TRVA0_036S00518 [Trichomonascus vanleenenianus]|uniref:uncharacterized protein n=1 Tax=Trichomonascus vanleenenianus TaxID=2268995 RepID=UPI003EC95394
MAFEPFDPSGENADLAFSMVVNESPGTDLSFGQSDSKAPSDSAPAPVPVPPVTSVGPIQDASILPVEDEFTRVMKAISSKLNSVTGKVNEPGIRRLAQKNNFDIFEENIPAGKRLSIGGSIILIDIEVSPEDQILDVKLSLGSSVKPSDEKYSLLSKQIAPTADEVLLKSLKEVRLTEFAKILRHLSRLDRLSTPDTVDCFVSLDELCTALFQLNAENSDPFSPYGLPVKNPKSRLGVGLWYWTKQRYRYDEDGRIDDAERYYAMLTIRDLVGGESQSGVRYSANWLKSPVGPEWNDPEPNLEAKGMFTLELDPPVITTRELAAKINANYEYYQSEYEDSGSIVSVQRPLHLPKTQTKEYLIGFTKSVPERLVKVNYVPISHPREIPRILTALRNARLLQSLWHSVTSHPGNQLAEQTDVDNEDYSFADAINEDEDKIIENSTTCYVNAYLTQLPNQITPVSDDSLLANLALGVSIGDESYTITVQDGAKGTITVSPPNEILKRALELTEDVVVGLHAAGNGVGAAEHRAGTADDAMRQQPAMY